MIIHNHDIVCWILGLLLISEVKTSCVLVNSTKSGGFNVVKGKAMDSRCLDGVILVNSKGERYCLAKTPNPAKKETLECLVSDAETNTETLDEEFLKKFPKIISVNHSTPGEFSEFSGEDGKMVSTFC